MAQPHMAVEPGLNVPDEADMLGYGMNVTPGALHRMGGLQTASAGQRQKGVDSVAAHLRDVAQIQPVFSSS